MSKIDSVKICANYDYHFDKIVSMIARDQLELSKYEEQENHNPKAVAIRKEKNNIAVEFVNSANDIVTLLNDTNNNYREKSVQNDDYYKKKCRKFEMYLRAIGQDPNLITYMKESDFR